MNNLIKSAIVFCFFVAAAMIVAAPASAQTQTKTDAKEVKEVKEVKKEATKTAGCCADKKGADMKECSTDKASDKDCCVEGKEGKHTKAEHEKMMKETEKTDAEKKDDGKKDDGR